MAVTRVTRISGNYLVCFDVVATADADTGTGNVAHGLSGTPVVPILTPLKPAGAKLSGWHVTTMNATNVALVKATTAGSGVTGNQVRATFLLPHTIII